MVEGELSTPRYIQAGVLQCSVLSPTLYSLYINDTLQALEVYLALFADACIPLIAKRVISLESSSAVSPQWSRGVSAGTLRLTKRLYFFHQRTPVEASLTL
jgi:hypothetical protein